MAEPSKAYKLLSDFESHLKNFCETSEKDFKQDLDSFQVKNFEVRDYEVNLGNHKTEVINAEVKKIILSVSVKVKILVLMEQGNLAKLIAELQHRLDNSLLSWSRDSKCLEKPINQIEGSPEVQAHSVSLYRNFDLVYRD